MTELRRLPSVFMMKLPPLESLPSLPTSVAACLYLLLLRWLARDFEAAFALCPACATDVPLTLKPSQLLPNTRLLILRKNFLIKVVGKRSNQRSLWWC